MNKVSIAGVRFIVTSACNYNCVYCHNEWEPKAIPLTGTEVELIDSIVASSKELNGKEVDITGGEPLLELERVKAVLNSAKKHGLWTNMTTNGYYLAENLENLKSWGLKEVHIHVPSLIPEKYTALMRGNSNFARVIEAVKKAPKFIDKVMINIPIEKGVNSDEIVEFIAFFGKLGVIPRFIESMSTKKFMPLNKESIENLIKEKLGNVKKEGEYLWGISRYSVGDYKFETLRCICFDRKCDVCPKTNFIHIDKDYKVRPCNLRNTKFAITKENSKEVLIDAYNFLKKQKDVPEEYNKIWSSQLNETHI